MIRRIIVLFFLIASGCAIARGPVTGKSYLIHNPGPDPDSDGEFVAECRMAFLRSRPLPPAIQEAILEARLVRGMDRAAAASALGLFTTTGDPFFPQGETYRTEEAETWFFPEYGITREICYVRWEKGILTDWMLRRR